MRAERIDPKTVDLDALVARGVSFHGHLGPMLVAGIRMGLCALELLDHPGYFDLHAESHAGSTPPVSCLNDGLQIGSGCTTGKGNLEITDRGEPAAHFRTPDGRRLGLCVRPELLVRFRALELSEASELARTCPVEKLLSWTWIESPSA